MKNFKQLERPHVGKGRQSVDYKASWTHDSGIKVRVCIRSDSYNFQSFAWLEAFSPTTQQWTRVVSLHYQEMSTVHGMIHLPDFQGDRPVPSTAVTRFQMDVNNLLKQYNNLMS